MEGKAATSAAQRVQVEQVVSAASAIEGPVAEMSLIAAVLEPAIARTVGTLEVWAIAAAAEVPTALVTAA